MEHVASYALVSFPKKLLIVNFGDWLAIIPYGNVLIHVPYCGSITLWDGEVLPDCGQNKAK